MKLINKLILCVAIIMSLFAISATSNFSNTYNAAEINLEELQINGSTVNHRGTSNPVMTPVDYTEKTTEVRAVWLAYVTADGPKFSNETKYKEDITAILDRMVALNLNTVFFQVRPMNDALYESEYAPWSRYLYGSSASDEGRDPGMDVLGYVIEEAHKRGIEFHAWLNPYRVMNVTSSESSIVKGTYLNTLHEDNFARQNQNLVITSNGSYNSDTKKYTYNLVLNPGEVAVQNYLYNVVEELMEKYDVDGIHFDDYFYSYSGTPNSEDQTAFTTNNPSGLGREDWRRNNVNTLVKGVSNSIRSHNANNGTTIKFGISPFGIWKNGNGTIAGGSNTAGGSSYTSQFADSKKWVEEKWVDYICPQTYWGFKLTAAPFADLVDWWSLVCETYEVDLIIGLGLYRVTETNTGWSQNPNELLDQINYCQQHEAIAGFSIFSYSYLNSSNTMISTQVNKLKTDYWTTMPTNVWATKATKLATPVLSINDNVISWNSIENASGYIVTLNGVAKPLQTLTSYTIENPTVGTTYTISVEAVPSGEEYEKSSTSETFVYGSKLNTPKNISFSGGALSWDSVPNADGYTVYIDGLNSSRDNLMGFSANKGTKAYNSDNLYFSKDDDTMLWNRSDLSINDNDDHGSRDQIVFVFNDPTKITFTASRVSATVLVHVGADGTILERAFGDDFQVLLNKVKTNGLKVGEVLMTSYGGASVFGGASVSSWSPNEYPLVAGDKISLVWSNAYDTKTNTYTFPTTTAGKYPVSIVAYSSNIGYQNSTASDKFDVVISGKLDAPAISLTNNVVSWGAISNADGYIVTVNGTDNPIQTKNSFTISTNESGSYKVKVKAIGNGIEYGDSDPSNEVVYNVAAVDDVPEIKITGTGSNGFYQEATITLTTKTSYAILYKINDGSWQTYNAASPIVLNTDGEYTIYYKLDVADAIQADEFLTIDNVAPEEPTIVILGDKNEDGKYIRNVAFSFDEITDGAIYYKVDLNGSSYVSVWTLFKGDVSLKSNGRYVVYYRATDEAGNNSKQQTATIDVILEISEDNPYVVRNGKEVTYYGTSDPIPLPTYTEKTSEVRAAWLSTVWNIDVPAVVTEADYKQKIIEILDTLLELNMNTIFFQVRSMNDAYYKSDYAPFSRFLKGTQGVDPGFDALGFVIEETHKRGMEFHAWLNPYRVTSDTAPKDTQLAGLADGNFAKENPSLVLADRSGNLILNPGEPRVRTYLRSVVSELLGLYDIDGIHFDDYFYSYGGTDNSEDQDAYDRYGNGLTRDDWRRKNVDDLIELISDAINEFEETKNKNVKFGISPFAIWRSKQEGVPNGSNTPPTNLQSYKDQYADSKKWVEEKWLDYICPQIYGAFNYTPMQYADMVDWWAGVCSAAGVDLMVGQGLYRAQDSSVTDWKDASELVEQIRYANQYDCVIGFSIFSYKNLLGTSTTTKTALERLVNHYWTQRVTFPWESDVDIYIYEITLNVDNQKGTISALPKEGFAYGEVVELTATPKSGYRFAGWRVDGEIISSEATESFTVTSDLAIEAVFEKLSGGDAPDHTLVIVLSSVGGVVLIGGVTSFVLIKRKKK